MENNMAIPSDPEDLDKELEEGGLGVDDDNDIEEDEELDGDALPKEDTDFSIKGDEEI